ncbi:MAG TPA: DUF1489 family protein [Rhodospirillales bacterium]|nr:DUF1489 family protein [Rhodospirillales bacterium]
MTVHLIKLAVGVEDIAHLARIQKNRLDESLREKGDGVLRHLTRNKPKRADELTGGGSIFWVIKGFIRVRQKVLGLEASRREDGSPVCGLVLDPELVDVTPRARKAFQGWRYLPCGDAPADLAKKRQGTPDIPQDMAAELKTLGLL